MMLVFIAMTGLVLDVGYSLVTARQLQTAADMAALAGAQVLSIDQTGERSRDKASSVALANKAAGLTVKVRDNPGNGEDGDIVIGRWGKNELTGNTGFTATLTKPNAVRVKTHRIDGVGDGPLGLLFGPIFGVDSVNIQREATAMMQPGAAWYALNETGTGAHFGGSITFNSYDGGGVVNSSSGSAVTSNGNPTIDTPYIKSPGSNASRYGTGPDQSFIKIAEPVPDPQRYLPALEVGGLSVDEAIAAGRLHDDTPADGIMSAPLQYDNYHYFANGMTGTLTLTTGIYIIDGGVHPDGITLAEDSGGVLLYVRSGSINMTGNRTVNIRPLDPRADPGQPIPDASTYHGISIWQPASNTSDATFHGTGAFDITGTIYIPTAQVYARGDIGTFGNRLIVGSLDIQGNVNIDIQFDPTSPGAPPYESFLVR